MRGFSTKNDKKPPKEDATEEPVAPVKKARGRPKAVKVEKTVEAVEAAEETTSKPVKAKTPVKRTRKTKVSAKDEPSTDIGVPRKMYVMKFQSPILPFAKFPLSHNRYIQDFLR